MSSFKDLALPLAAKNIPVIRLHHRSKKPIDSAWPNLATTDTNKILAWDADTPTAGCAAVAKNDGVLFFESDEENTIERYEKETAEEFPVTYRSQSRPGRDHFYFLQTDESRACGSITQREIPFGSLRQNNAYVVAVGSIHEATGLPYEIVQDEPLVPIPAKFIEWLQTQKVKSTPTTNNLVGTKAPIPRGAHDVTLTAICGKWWSDGLSKEFLLPALIQECEERCEGYGSDYQEMCAKIVKSITMNYKQGSADPTVLIGGKPPCMEVLQPVSPSANAVAEVVPAIIRAEQLPVEEGEDPQWVDVFGVIHPGLIPPSALDDVVEVEDLSAYKIRPLNFSLLVGKKRLKKKLPSWLQANATPLGGISEVDWVAASLFMRSGQSIWCAKQGSFKSILALLFALALLDADQNPGKDVFFLGRKINVAPRDPKDKRPLRVHFLDNDSPRTLTETNCALVGLNQYRANGTFILYGAWEEHPITAMDDPRLIEAAKRDRSIFIFDCLSYFSEGLDLNNPKDSTYVMTKGKKLGYISEGILVLHHDNKNEKGGGWSGSTPIVSVPDMSFNLKREDDTNRVTFRPIRLKACERFNIEAELSFNSRVVDPSASGIIASDNKVTSVTYKVWKDTLDPETRKLEQKKKEANEECRKLTSEEKAAKKAKERQAQLEQQKKDDTVLIERAVKVIKRREAGGKPPMVQSSLAKELGVKDHKAWTRVFCASTPEEPRPWITCLDSKGKSLLFFSDNKQRNIFEGVDPEFDEKQAAKEKEKKDRAAKKKKNAEEAETNPPARVSEDAAWAGRTSV
jgi:hypothetical protein